MFPFAVKEQHINIGIGNGLKRIHPPLTQLQKQLITHRLHSSSFNIFINHLYHFLRLFFAMIVKQIINNL